MADRQKLRTSSKDRVKKSKSLHIAHITLLHATDSTMAGGGHPMPAATWDRTQSQPIKRSSLTVTLSPTVSVGLAGHCQYNKGEEGLKTRRTGNYDLFFFFIFYFRPYENEYEKPYRKFIIVTNFPSYLPFPYLQVNLSPCLTKSHSMKTYGEWSYNSTHS
jgi:hypothetical protein